MNAFLFPGQGEECPQMASYYLQRPGPVQRLLSVASEALSIDLAQVIMKGAPALTQTEILQPALTAISAGLALELQQQILPKAVAGHSLGELSAAAISGCITSEQVVLLSVSRGRVMAEAARQHPGAMLATSVELAEQEGIELAAHNAPSQWVYTGERGAIESLSSKVASTRVPVSGAWHSRLMREAQRHWMKELQKISWRDPALDWFCNMDGSLVKGDASVMLAEQFTRPIRWVAVMQNLWQQGYRSFYLIGPSRALRGLCRGNLPPTAKIICVSGKKDISQEVA